MRATMWVLADLEAVAAEIAEQVRVLDGLVRHWFGESNGAHAGRCFIGPYVRQTTALAAIRSYGPADTTANIFSHYSPLHSNLEM